MTDGPAFIDSPFSPRNSFQELNALLESIVCFDRNEISGGLAVLCDEHRIVG